MSRGRLINLLGKSYRHQFVLTQRELDVLELMTQALSNREISDKLGVSVETVRMHAKNIYAKLGVSGRHQAGLKAIELDLVQFSTSAQVSIPTNLPTNRDKFIGRIHELSALSRIFNRGEQLITIIGTGGMGKTRLALEYAYQHLTDYTNGVFFISLESVKSVESIILQFVEHLAIPVSSKFSYEQQVLDFLSNKDMLLVVDNWEHLLDGAIILSQIVQVSPHIHIIATSREDLALQQTVVYRLRGLATPAFNALDNSHNYDALQFLQLVIQRQLHNWTITEDNIASAIKLCNLVEGMPLGILLAASWASVYSLDQILIEIQSGISFLKSDLQDLPQRHRSIYDVFEWSWRLLTPEECTTFMKMSVFRNGCTLAAVQHITQASPQVLQSLIIKSLIERSATGRYQMHELLRQFGELKLQEDKVVEAETRDRHARYYADIAVQIMSNRLMGQKALVEFDNSYVAWYWAVDTRKFDILKRYISTYGLISFQFNNHIEVRRLLDYALQSPDIYTADSLTVLGNLKFVRSAIIRSPSSTDWQRTRQLLEEGEAIFADVDWAQLDLDEVCAFYYCALGYRIIDYKKTISIVTKIINVLQPQFATGDILLKTLLTYAYSQMCHVWHIFGSELETAKRYGIQSLQMAREIKHQTLIALNTGYLGNIEFVLGNHEQANHYFQESILVHQDLNATFDFGYILQYAGENALMLAHYDEAQAYLKHSLDLLNGYGPINGMLTLACIVAWWKYNEKDYISATEWVAYCQHNDLTDRVNNLIYRMWGTFDPPIASEVYQLATERGKTMDYDTVVLELYTWLEG